METDIIGRIGSNVSVIRNSLAGNFLHHRTLFLRLPR